MQANFLQVSDETHCLLCHENIKREDLRAHWDALCPFRGMGATPCGDRCPAYAREMNPRPPREHQEPKSYKRTLAQTIYDDLMEIAGKGEYEDMSREVERYFVARGHKPHGQGGQ